MLLVFCGTPRFAVPTFEKLVEAGHSVPLVVTQPDRPRGRGMDVAVSPVKDAATRLGIVVLQPGTIKNNAEFRSQLAAIAPDAIIVVGYGRIIPQWMIDLPRLGNLNLHASLLPKYRGAAPIQRAIANGESDTGVTTMRIDAGHDTGHKITRKPRLPRFLTKKTAGWTSLAAQPICSTACGVFSRGLGRSRRLRIRPCKCTGLDPGNMRSRLRPEKSQSRERACWLAAAWTKTMTRRWS